MARQEVATIFNTDDTPSSGIDNTALQNYLEQRLPYPIAPGEDPETTDYGTAEALILNGTLFQKDATDTTSVHDGVNVIVDSEGTRFLANLVKSVYSVLDNINATPATPNVGDVYLVDTAPSGQWATDSAAEKVAIYTPWEWIYVTPKVGMIVYVEDENLHYMYDLNGNWVRAFNTGSFKTLTTVAIGMSAVTPGNTTYQTEPADTTEGKLLASNYAKSASTNLLRISLFGLVMVDSGSSTTSLGLVLDDGTTVEVDALGGGNLEYVADEETISLVDSPIVWWVSLPDLLGHDIWIKVKAAGAGTRTVTLSHATIEEFEVT